MSKKNPSKQKNIVKNKETIKVKVNDPNKIKDLVIKTYKGNFSKDSIKATTQLLSNELKNRNFKGEVQVSLYYGKDSPLKTGWGASKWVKPGEDIKLFNAVQYEDTYEEPKTFKEFRFYVRKFK